MNFEIYFVGRHIWQLCEMSEFHIVRDEPGANSTCLHQGADWDGPERNRIVGFWMSPGDKGQ